MSDISIAGYWLVFSTLKNYSLVCLNLNHEVEYAANQWTRNSSTIEEEFKKGSFLTSIVVLQSS